MQFGSSAEKLLYNLLEKIIPQETMQMLQPDNLRQIAGQVGNTLTGFKIQQEDILANQAVIMEALNVGDKYCNRAASALPIGDGSGRNGNSGGNSDCAGGSASGQRAA